MALPIAPTPILTGKSAEALDRYMADSDHIRDSLVMPKIDEKVLNSILQQIHSRRTSWELSHAQQN